VLMSLQLVYSGGEGYLGLVLMSLCLMYSGGERQSWSGVDVLAVDVFRW